MINGLIQLDVCHELWMKQKAFIITAMPLNTFNADYIVKMMIDMKDKTNISRKFNVEICTQ